MRYLHQVDFIKCFAAISVIILHSIPTEILIKTYSVFYFWQAVPLFIILMGFNLGLSKSQKYSVNYFNKRYKRIIKPFLIVFIISMVFGYIFYKDDFYIGILTIIGFMPKTGPGNYYITLLLQFILLAPILYWSFKKKPKLTIFTLFMLDIIYQIINKWLGLFSENEYFYSSSIIRYLSAIGIGLWLSNGYQFNLKRNKWIIIAALFSVAYLFMGNTFPGLYFNDGWRTQNFLSFFYPALLIILAINFLPNTIDSLLTKIGSEMGKASYHIFLVQMIYFAIVPIPLFIGKFPQFLNYYTAGGILIIVNLVICLGLGLLFYRIDTSILFSKEGDGPNRGQSEVLREKRHN